MQRQILELNHCAGRHVKGALNGIAQFTDIAGEIVALQHLPGILLDPLDLKRHAAEYCRHGSSLLENVAAESGHPGDPVTHIDGLGFFESCELTRAEYEQMTNELAV
jgi:hypothetical protein